MGKYDRSPKITKTCEQCGELFARPDHKVWRGSRYCSRTCYHAAWRALPEEERQRRTAGAHDAVRGMKRSAADLEKRARTKQERAQLSGDEAEILAAFQVAGLHPVPLLAFGKYNIDFAFPEQRVAVEYHGGGWHGTPAKREQDANKAESLRAAGWTLLVYPSLYRRNREKAITTIVEETRKALHR